jgi:hypothetical protein
MAVLMAAAVLSCIITGCGEGGSHSPGVEPSNATRHQLDQLQADIDQALASGGVDGAAKYVSDNVSAGDVVVFRDVTEKTIERTIVDIDVYDKVRRTWLVGDGEGAGTQVSELHFYQNGQHVMIVYLAF